MNMADLPAPLVPAEVDLRGYEFMPLYGDRLFKSETWISASPEAKVACLRLWWHAYAHEVPASSLPDSDALLADYAGYGIGVKAWRRVRAAVMRGYCQCADGRWYHPFLAELALEAWEYRQQQGETAEAKQTRQQRWRDRCKLLSQQLRDLGITPPRGASLETLERLHDAASKQSTPSTQASTQASTGDDVEIGKTGQDRTGQKTLLSANADPSPAAPIDCPHQKIIDLYHQHLPLSPRVASWTDTRASYLRARWREMRSQKCWKSEADGLAFFERFFKYVAESKFLTGQADGRQGHKPFLADLEWLVKTSNFVKVIEGKYNQ